MVNRSHLVEEIGENLTEDNVVDMMQALEIRVDDINKDGIKFMKYLNDNGLLGNVSKLGDVLKAAKRDDLVNYLFKYLSKEEAILEPDSRPDIRSYSSLIMNTNKPSEVSVNFESFKDEDEYFMKTIPCGKALIFNNQFNVDVQAQDNPRITLTKRIGTNFDLSELENTLTWLQFKVTVFNDLDSQTIFEKLSREIKDETLTAYSCLVVCILSHGNKNLFYDVNGKPIKIREIVDCFTIKNCPNLAEKPKLFFVQACQGRKISKLVHDGGVTKSEKEEYLSVHADQFAFHSSYPGTISVRDERSGSWFMQTLCKVLQENAEHCYLNEIVIKVNEKIASRAEKTEDGSIEAMMSNVGLLTLRKKLKFNPLCRYLEYQGPGLGEYLGL